ncbi:hypothetical protein EK21DRAFT_106483 [Setomelanomma holmii]|uniref:Uncharacterized protein n=1 Tax=Setomelanomma holmii TaxID=210430 RepID=A0A9P4HNV6_9PLEO|nr:hypothetical protein EK21DRAFT_106483 [Setomelanomma holmii]
MRWLLCRASRVNRHFNDVIRQSPSVQEALFLRRRNLRYRDSTPEFNPLLVYRFHWGYFHPVLAPEPARPPQGFPIHKKKLLRAIEYEKASWREMFPVLPPIRNVVVERRSPGTFFTGDKVRTGRVSFKELDNNDGLRMGLLFDICEEWKEPKENVAFGIEWMCTGDLDPRLRLERSPSIIRAHKISPRVLGFAGMLFALRTQHNQGSSTELMHVTSVDGIVILLQRFNESLRWAMNQGAYPKIESQAKAWSMNSVDWEGPDPDVTKDFP